jgi:hypothetical protein
MENKMKYPTIEIGIFGIIFLFVFVFSLGWLLNLVYQEYTNHRAFDGLNIRDSNEVSALETVSDYDELGDWVCVNIKGMDYSRAIETCNHEVGHEIFAEYCENHIDKCINVTKD